MCEEVQFDSPSPKYGVLAVEFVSAALKTQALVERNGRAHSAAGQYRNGKIVWADWIELIPFEETRLYKVACNNFMATGGDDNNVLSRGRNRSDSGRSIRDALEAFIAARSKDGGALDYKADGRIRRRGAGSTGDAGER